MSRDRDIFMAIASTYVPCVSAYFIYCNLDGVLLFLCLCFYVTVIVEHARK